MMVILGRGSLRFSEASLRLAQMRGTTTRFAMNGQIFAVQGKTDEPHLLGHDAVHLLVGRKPRFRERVGAIWSRMQERNDQLITGALALGEVLRGAYKQGVDRERMQAVRAAFEAAVSKVIPFTSLAADRFGHI